MGGTNSLDRPEAPRTDRVASDWGGPALLCVVAAIPSGSATLLALIAATYTHQGSSPFASPLAQWGQFLLALSGCLLVWLAYRRLDRGAMRSGIALALAALLTGAGWWLLMALLLD